MKTLGYLIDGFIIFCCGFTLCANLGELLDLGSDYQPSWSNVFLAILMAVVVSLKIITFTRE